MSETLNLLRFFRIDQQVRGLRSRLTGAERFLAEQQKQHAELTARSQTLATTLKNAKAAAANAEGEAQRIEVRMATLREQMNGARTNKEYTAFLNEVNTLKTQKEAADQQQLDHLQLVENSTKQAAQIETDLAQRAAMLEKAKNERVAREAEIKDRLAELTTERMAVRQEVASDAVKQLEEMIAKVGDDAMCAVEEIDRRNHEWSCGACRMALPPQVLSLLTKGSLVRCPSCRCFLFTEQDVASKKLPKPKKEKGEALEA